MAEPGIRLITPAVRPSERLPRWAVVTPIAALAVGWIAGFSDHAIVQGAEVAALGAAALAGCALGGWLEQRITYAFAYRRTAARVGMALALPLGGLVLGTIAAGVLEELLDDLGIDGVAIATVFIGALWFAGAAIGSLTVVVIDVVVSAVVARFRTRLVLAFLLLLGLVGALTGALVRGVESAVSHLAEHPEQISIDVGSGPDADFAGTFAAWIAEHRELAFVFFTLLGVLMLVPAVTSAAGQLADATMERIHPLVHVFDAVARGERNVRLEEAGSADFIEVSRHFNRMIDDLQLGENMERAFGAYVSPHVLAKIRGQHGEALIAPAVREATVFFGDIRGFTSLSEQLAPEIVVAILNRYFERVVDVIAEHDGYLNKFIGDAVVVVFNGPIDQADHAARAVRCAVDVLAAVRTMNEAGAFHEIGALRVGIGVATGPMVCGNVGSERQMEYTVIGDTVNLASRIEGMTKLYGAQLLVSDRTRAQLGDGFALRCVDKVAAKGKREPVTLYEVLDGLAPGDRQRRLDGRATYEDARARFEAGELDAANLAFAACLERDPDDLAAALGVERCRSFAREGLPHEWDGVVRLESK